MLEENMFVLKILEFCSNFAIVSVIYQYFHQRVVILCQKPKGRQYELQNNHINNLYIYECKVNDLRS